MRTLHFVRHFLGGKEGVFELDQLVDLLRRENCCDICVIASNDSMNSFTLVISISHSCWVTIIRKFVIQIPIFCFVQPTNIWVTLNSYVCTKSEIIQKAKKWTKSCYTFPFSFIWFKCTFFHSIWVTKYDFNSTRRFAKIKCTCIVVIEHICTYRFTSVKMFNWSFPSSQRKQLRQSDCHRNVHINPTFGMFFIYCPSNKMYHLISHTFSFLFNETT